VNIAREAHLSNQSDPASGNSGAIGLFGGDLKVWCIDSAACLLAQFREKLGNDIIPRVPRPVLRFEELLPDDALSIDEEIPWARHALVRSDRFGVQQPISPNDLGIGVGEQREFDLSPTGEVSQDCFTVVADSRQLDSLFLKSRFRRLQLDQLLFAVRSPIGRTDKEKNRALRPF
jgi:hypothetical protein